MQRGAPDVFERRAKSRRCGLEAKYHYQDRQAARLDGVTPAWCHRWESSLFHFFFFLTGIFPPTRLTQPNLKEKNPALWFRLLCSAPTPARNLSSPSKRVSGPS